MFEELWATPHLAAAIVSPTVGQLDRSIIVRRGIISAVRNDFMIVEYNEAISFQGAPSPDAKRSWRETGSGALNSVRNYKVRRSRMLSQQANNALQGEQQKRWLQVGAARPPALRSQAG